MVSKLTSCNVGLPSIDTSIATTMHGEAHSYRHILNELRDERIVLIAAKFVSASSPKFLLLDHIW